MQRAVSLNGARLKIFDAEFDTRSLDLYAVAFGKAAGAMALALDRILGARLREGVISAPPLQTPLPARWRTFAGGHPLPNDASLAAAHAAFDLLRRAAPHTTVSINDAANNAHNANDADNGNNGNDANDAGDGNNADDGSRVLIIFLVSGGGSAMLELPRDEGITLEDLRAMNRTLVTCGAGIAEINAVRRAVSAVKGGGLSRTAPHAAQVTLIISDVGADDERTVASGATFTIDEAQNAREAQTVVARYHLAARLPASIIQAVARTREQSASESADETTVTARANEAEAAHAVVPEVARIESAHKDARANDMRRHFVLLDNEHAIERAAELARTHGFAVEIARDLVEQNVAEGARLLVSRLLELRERTDGGQGVCVVSGGEFACPVRGAGGAGGRNSETVMRCALELEARARSLRANSRKSSAPLPRVVALSAGTDGIDGNSPAAGALCDETTITRARALGLDAHAFLDASDSYTFFNMLGDTLVTGATGTNVRDLRILLAKG